MNSDMSRSSGKAIAQMRRAMLSQTGKSATNVSSASLRQAAAAHKPAQTSFASESSTSSYEATSQNETMSVREVNRLRRQAMSVAGKKAASTVTQTVTRTASERVFSAAETTGSSNDVSNAMTMHVISSENQYQSLPVAPTGRSIAMARRQAMATSGKTGQQKVAQAAKIAMSNPNQDFAAVLEQGLTGRQLAMHRRAMLASQGADKTHKTGGVRPTGKVRPKTLPTKVEFTQTLSGQTVSGSTVDTNKSSVTGIERGECRSVTGTEYLSNDHFASVCGTKPQANPSKVSSMTTLSNKTLTGVDASVSSKVTGVSAGACRAISGIEYWGAEHYKTQGCDTRPAARPAKVSEMNSCSQQQVVTGTDVAQGSRVTGGDSGMSRSITGSCYMDQRQAAKVPPSKVEQSHTARGSSVTGSLATRSSTMTGGEAGACRAVTGSEYLTSEDFSACGVNKFVSNADKVVAGSSAKGMTVTGQLLDDTAGRVTGNEIRKNERVTGNQYHDRQLASFSARNGSSIKRLNASLIKGVDAQQESSGFPKAEGDGQNSMLSVTGHSYAGNQAVTGNRKGLCQVLTGDTPEVTDLMTAYCQTNPLPVVSSKPVSGDLPLNNQRMTGNDRGICDGGVVTGGYQADTLVDCARPSVQSEQRAMPYASLERNNRLTGNASWDDGIVTGTRGFDRRSAPARQFMNVSMAQTMKQVKTVVQPAKVEVEQMQAAPVQMIQPAVAEQVVNQVAPAVLPRLTGDGSQQGVKVSGDAWANSRHVTGTEGFSSRGRNLTERGQHNNWVVGASVYKDVPKQEERQSSVKITGSSGNGISKGAAITYSGGARG